TGGAAACGLCGVSFGVRRINGLPAGVETSVGGMERGTVLTSSGVAGGGGEKRSGTRQGRSQGGSPATGAAQALSRRGLCRPGTSDPGNERPGSARPLVGCCCECFHSGAISPPSRPGATKWRPAAQKQNTTLPRPAKTLGSAFP